MTASGDAGNEAEDELGNCKVSEVRILASEKAERGGKEHGDARLP